MQCQCSSYEYLKPTHDDVIKWKHFRVTGHLRGNSPVPGEFLSQSQWHGALMFSLICVWINDWVNNREACDLRRYRAHYDVIVMSCVTKVHVPDNEWHFSLPSSVLPRESTDYGKWCPNSSSLSKVMVRDVSKDTWAIWRFRPKIPFVIISSTSLFSSKSPFLQIW